MAGVQNDQFVCSATLTMHLQLYILQTCAERLQNMTAATLQQFATVLQILWPAIDVAKKKKKKKKNIARKLHVDRP